MKRDIKFVWTVLLLFIPVFGFAQDAEDEGITSYTGVTWGVTRTFWGSNTGEGYAHAGTAGPVIGLRKVKMVGSNAAFVPYITYMAMFSGPITTTQYLQDSILVSRHTTRSYFREIDLGFNLNYYFGPNRKSFYVGLGPSIRWGQSGERTDDARPAKTMKAAWFGTTVLVGYQAGWGKKTVVFFEPQFTFSPDPADRWQMAYPPDNLNLHMGILF
ncbi:MAG TPA: hypothetical protein VGL38_05185 [bacterium]|jgi:hypothetical protein